MKFDFSCPKCESKDVVEIVGSSMNQYTKIPLTKWGMKNEVLDRYVCVECGYTEEYVQLSNSFKKWGYKMLSKQGGKDEFV